MANYTNYTKKISDNQIRIGEVRFSYAHVFSPRTDSNGKAKYSCALLIHKENKEAVKAIEDAIEAAKEYGRTKMWGNKIPTNCHSPLRDGDEEKPDDENYAGCWFINTSATADRKPQVKVMEDGQVFDALDEGDFYSGCYGIAVVGFFPYVNSGNKGVGVGLNIVCKTRDGEKFSGGVSAEAALGDLLG